MLSEIKRKNIIIQDKKKARKIGTNDGNEFEKKAATKKKKKKKNRKSRKAEKREENAIWGWDTCLLSP